MLVFVLGQLLFVLLTDGYSFGAPPEGCNKMVPNHGEQPQQGPVPYVLEVATMFYSPGDNIELTLRGKEGEIFRGFLVQARTDARKYNTVGRLTGDTILTTTECDTSEASLTHADNERKTRMQFIWTAPDTNVGPVTFVYTVVKEYSTYWTKLTSDTITFRPTEEAGEEEKPKQGEKEEEEEEEDTQGDGGDGKEGEDGKGGTWCPCYNSFLLGFLLLFCCIFYHL